MPDAWGNASGTEAGGQNVWGKRSNANNGLFWPERLEIALVRNDFQYFLSRQATQNVGGVLLWH